MSAISSNLYQLANNALDYIPVVSSIKVAVQLFKKQFPSKTQTPSYLSTFKHSLTPVRREGCITRSICISIPFLGNLFIALFDTTAYVAQKILLKGNPEPIDLEKAALVWGSAEAALKLANIKPEEKIQWMLEAASLGNITANEEIKLSDAEIEEKFQKGWACEGEKTPEKAKEAVRLYEEVVENGQPTHHDRLDLTLYRLGLLYEKGIGVEKDPKKAFIYYTMSADKGYTNATAGLGTCYEKGIGVDIDLEKAIDYYERAKDSTRALNNLGLCYEKGIGVKKDLNKAFTYYKKAVVNDRCPEALFHVGRCYEKGIGVDVNKDNAKHYFSQSFLYFNMIPFYCDEEIRKEVNQRIQPQTN